MLYIGLLRGGDPIAECKDNKAARTFAKAISVSVKQSKASFTCDQMNGHSYIRDNQDVIVVVCDSSQPRRKAFGLIELVERNLAIQSPQEAIGSAAESFSWDDPITSAQGDINQVRTIMIENVDKLLERGERIGLLVDRTQELSTGSHSFRKQATAARSRLWWKNIRMIALLVVFLIVFVLLVHFFF